MIKYVSHTTTLEYDDGTTIELPNVHYSERDPDDLPHIADEIETLKSASSASSAHAHIFTNPGELRGYNWSTERPMTPDLYAIMRGSR